MPGPQNRSVTLQAATAVVNRIEFARVGSGVQATVFGTVSVSDGTVRMEPVSWTLSGAALTTITNLMDGAALTRWRTAMGIEAP